ncbi:MAG TPA: tetratricopeptide repeat protein [Syntrophales bacterium]|nr:tetratricopeptide repeat protein [Syntrophales bacterium]
MLKKKYQLFSLLFVVLLIAIPANSYAQDAQKDDEYYNKIGMGYFNKGFHNDLPRNDSEEASNHFERAIAAFKMAIAINKDCIQAHRNLARVYYVQKRYEEAAEQYRNVTALNPTDIDAYVVTALAYTKALQYDEAIEQLNIAKTLTDDKKIVLQLDEYINRIAEEKRLR